MTKIANSGHDENGRWSGGRAGDQDGSEWEVRQWYPRPWDHVALPPSKRAGETIASYAKHAAQNDHIGYDQNQRETFWDELSKVKNHDPKYITEDCEADCSAGVAAIVKAVGYRLKDARMKSVPVDMWTGNEVECLSDAGFKIVTASKYTGTDAYLVPGAILINEAHHTAINLTAGSKAGYVPYKKSKPKAKTKKWPDGTEFTDYVVLPKNGLNCRREPSTDSPVTRVLRHGATTHIACIRDGWAQTKTGDWCCMGTDDDPYLRRK